MRKLIVAAMVALISMLGVVAIPQAAHADKGSPKGMTLKEWRKIKKGMTRQQVTRIVGVGGKVVSTTRFGGGDRSVTVEYRQCFPNGKVARGSWNTVWITYDNYRYGGQWGIQKLRTPMQVDYKGAWTTPFVF